MNASQQEWFVVRSKSRKEELAVQSLERRGIAAFCPRILEPVGWTNDWATVPLFPGYLFVDIVLQAAYHTVIWTPGVKAFVAFGEIPTAIAPGVINFLRQQTGSHVHGRSNNGLFECTILRVGKRLTHHRA